MRWFACQSGLCRSSTFLGGTSSIEMKIGDLNHFISNILNDLMSPDFNDNHDDGNLAFISLLREYTW